MLKFDISHLYNGTGVSQGLDRGLLVYKDDNLLLEEGMGLGACAFQTGGYTYFASIKEIKKTGDSFAIIYIIDTTLELKVLGIKSRFIVRVQEFIAKNIYMKYIKSQKLILMLWTFSNIIFNVKSYFVKVPILGEMRVLYSLKKNDILVDISCATKKICSKIFVMNELGGSFFDKSIVSGEFLDPPSGWQKMESLSELFSSTQSLAFTIEEKNIPDNVKSNLYWGREQIQNKCCWAGFESEIICDSCKFEHYQYLIKFREVTK